MQRLNKAILLALFTTIASAQLQAQTVTVEEAQSIARLYSASLDRPPRFNGLNFFINSVESGRSIIGIAEDFVESAEFEAKYGTLNKRGYVEQLFRNVLGREGAQGGIDFWVGVLSNGKSRAFVLTEFADSPENITKTDFLYGSMLFADDQWEYNRLQNLGEQFCPAGQCIQAQLNGPLGGSLVAVTALRNPGNVIASNTTLDEQALIAQLGNDTWDNLSRVDRLSLLGIAPVSQAQAQTLYLVTVSAGFDYDYDLNSLSDNNPSRLRGEVHAIVTGEQISTGMQINALTEVAYQGVIGTLALLDDGQVLGRLNTTANQMLTRDLNGDRQTDYGDVLAWRRLTDTEALRNEASDLNKLTVAVVAGTDDESLGILSNRARDGSSGLGLNETKAATVSPDGTCDGRGRTINNRRQESITTSPPSEACGTGDRGKVESNQGNIAGVLVPDEQGVPTNMNIRSSTVRVTDIDPQARRIEVEYDSGNGDTRRGEVPLDDVPDNGRLRARYQSIQANDDTASMISVASSKPGKITSADDSQRFDDTVSDTMTYGALASNWAACVTNRFAAAQEAEGNAIDSAVRRWAESGCASALAETDNWEQERTQGQIEEFEGAVPDVVPVGCTDCFSYIANPPGPIIVQVGENPGFNGVAPASSTRVQWNFGNGDSAGSRSPAYSYPAPGNFVAQFTVTYSDGSMGADDALITVVAPQSGCFKDPEVRVTSSTFTDPVTDTDSVVLDAAATAFGDNCQIAALDVSQIDGEPSVDLLFDVFGQGQTSFVKPGVEQTIVLTFQVRATDSEGNSSVTTVPVNIQPEGGTNSGTDPSSSIEGIWVFPDITPENTHLIFRADGTYFLHEGFYFGTEDDPDYCAGGGSESGTFERSLETGALTATPTFDENGECGLSNPKDGRFIVTTDGDTLFIEEGLGANKVFFTLERFAGSTPPALGPVASVIGEWGFQGAPPEDLFFNLNADGTWRFFNSGRFVEECDDGGTDRSGTFEWNRATTAANYFLQAVVVGVCSPDGMPSPGDTSTGSLVPFRDGNTMLLVNGEGNEFVIERIGTVGQEPEPPTPVPPTSEYDVYNGLWRISLVFTNSGVPAPECAIEGESTFAGDFGLAVNFVDGMHKLNIAGVEGVFTSFREVVNFMGSSDIGNFSDGTASFSSDTSYTGAGVRTTPKRAALTSTQVRG